MMMGFRFPVVFLFAALFSTTNGFCLPSSTTTPTPTSITTKTTTTTSLLSSSSSSSSSSSAATDEEGTSSSSESESNLKRLQELVIEHLALDESTVKINETTNFREDLGADSLDVIELVLSVEQEFDINIDDDYASKIATVKDALDYLKATHDIHT